MAQYGIGFHAGDKREKGAFATKTAVIVGCDKICAKKIFDQRGFMDCVHVELGTLGMEKGQTPANDENIERAAAIVAEALGGKTAK